eukprot:gene11568-14722_t
MEVSAEWFVACDSVEEWREALLEARNLKLPLFVLGGGSNILFTRHVQGLVAMNRVSGISLLREDDEFFYVKAGAGENWH